MPIVSKVVLKSYFEDGKEPHEGKYIDLIDTMGTVDGDHGALSGLGDDDHSQYLLASGTRVCTGSFYVNNGVYVTGGGIFVHGSGSGVPGTIGGLEIEWDGTQSDLLSYNRNTSTYQKLRYRANEHVFTLGTTTRLTINTSGLINNNNAAISGGLYIGSSSPVTTAGRLKMTNNLYMGGGITIGYVGGAGHADGIFFYSGTTQVGEIDTQDTVWLRINQDTGKHTYTPGYFYGAAGLRAGSVAATPAGGDVTYADRLKKDLGGTDYSGGIYIPLGTHIPAVHYWATPQPTADSFTYRTVTSEFPGVPANVRAIVLRIHARDWATHPQTALYFQVGEANATNRDNHLAVHPHGNDMFSAAQGIVPVYNNQIFIRWKGSASNSLDTWLTCVGYFV